ncbi:MarR family winged helix-turn-helix transcriptional regulator [Kosakonia oryziphila]|uniref:DNA-binding transcriptional regulator, MarR family n=1 Tax=Kosakonia oryziphila TaxID=1005667 RepID=A0A1C4BBG9_9ENTR|nr:MarR family winged helix-turn-helix transcriptional regulator [Kosakonia oryziphila]SCC04124.1 DNA-binding transcriptional regulator, MarR family [Kosakonia oryziphila]
MNNVDLVLLKNIPETCPGFQARATARAITRYYNSCFKPYGLTSEQFSLLVGIGSAPNETVTELAARAGIDSTTLSRNIRSLESRGVIASVGGRGRAGKRLNLTEEGWTLLTTLIPVWQSAMAELTHQMGSESLSLTTQKMRHLAKISTSL